MGNTPRDLDFGEFLTQQATAVATRKKFSHHEQELAIDVVLEAYLDALRQQATAMHIFAEAGEVVRIQIDCQGDNSISKQKNIGVSFDHIVKAVNDRICSWPELGDTLCEVSPNGNARLRFAPFSPFHLQANVIMRQSGSKQCDAISFSEATFDYQHNTLDVLGVDGPQKEFIREGLSHKGGLVLANRSSNVREIDGIALILALRPDALYIRDEDARSSLEELVSAAQEHLVIVGSSLIDPIEMMIRTLGYAEGKSDLARSLLDSLRVVAIHRRLRRNCAACNKATEVTAKIREYYPPELRAILKDSYSYGSRCSDCSFSGFRGSVGASSVLLADSRVKKLLGEKSSGESIAQYVYKLGTLPLLMDGLNKVFVGQSVFSDLHEAAPRVSPYFLSAVRIAQEMALHSVAMPAEEPVIEKAKVKEEIATRASSPHRKEEVSHKPGPKRILIIEDDPAQRDILQLALQGQGYLVSSVGEAEDAFGVLEQHPVDLIVSDYMLPGMNGAQFLEKVKTDPRYKMIPAIILTVMGDEETEFKILSGYADEFCSKDVSRRVLMKRIERLLSREVEQDAQKKPAVPNPLKHLLNE